MDRLTEYFAGIEGAFPNISANKKAGAGFRPCDEVCASVEGRCENCQVQNVIASLAAYEDTNLAPSAITALQAEAERLRAALKQINDLAVEFMEGGPYDPGDERSFAIVHDIYEASAALERGKEGGE